AQYVAAQDVAAQAIPAQGTAAQDFTHEATIEQLHALMLSRRLTAVDLVQAYLDRIDAYDKRGPSLNAITVINPDALGRAAELDAELARTGALSGPLHGIPVIVKDNYDTADLTTAAGSRALADVLPVDDAFMVRRLREAGAI